MLFYILFTILGISNACGYYHKTMLYEGQACFDEKYAVGCCKPLSQCPSAMEKLGDRNYPKTCSYVRHEIIVCCSESCELQRPPSEAPYVWGSGEWDESIPNKGAEPIKKERKSVQVCNEHNRIHKREGFHIAAIGGDDAKLDEFPHMAAIGWYNNNGGISWNCGGTLISERYVLTAAHCSSTPMGTSLAQSTPSVVRLGDLNILDKGEDGAKSVDVKIKRIIKHPQYKPPMQYFDIALIELSNVINPSTHVKPACLWTEEHYGTSKQAIVTGWGVTKLGAQEISPHLQKVSLDILNTTICNNLLLPFHSRKFRGIYEHQMCAGDLAGGKDACQGDSGGPLQIKQDNRYYIIGITSFGRQCALPNQPGIYTKVSYFLDWIENIVWPED